MAGVIEVREFGGPEVLKLAEASEPGPRPEEAVIAAGVADVLFIDTAIRAGQASQWFGVRPPYLPGTGVAGTVTAAGAGVDPGLVGRRVVARTGDGNGTGGYVERAVVPAGQLIPVPDGVSLADAAGVMSDGATALGLMAGTGVRAGEWVLILGAAGGLGLLLTQLARAAGGHVVAALRMAGAAQGEPKAARARAAGAEAVVDYSDPGWTARVTALTGGTGPAVVFDGAGGSLGVAAFGITAAGGRFSAHGAPSGGFAPVDRDQAAQRGITVQGIDQVQFSPEVHEKLTAQALAEVAAGRLRPVIGQTYPLDRAADAHRGLEARTAVGKTLLIVDEAAA
ncbi:MAG TPA: zinc-binding dehydrogenase [Streptosporangiaceae bacterium]|jgi:NADPH2:quinone reductase|nr:zinc-binding dehydrogenase [Streptosporangiaceae bacterium]